MPKTLDATSTTIPSASTTRVEVLANLQTTEAGLTAEEAASRLQTYGPNEAVSARQQGALAQLLPLVTNPLVLILLVASLASAALGDRVNAIIIATIVLLSVALNFTQTFRSQQAANRLRAQVAPTSTVLRDGEWRELPCRELVPGDIIRLSAGDLVPADARLLTARDLHVQQAALTGESLPVEKDARDDLTPRPPLQSGERETHSAGAEVGSGSAAASAEQANMVMLGTSVVSGIGTAVVFATGPQTQFGDIAARLASRAPETEFDRGIRRFGLLILRTVIFLVLFVLVVNLAFHRNPFESLLFAVALAVGLTPEFLPMITTVTLGQGALRMARKKVIVKHLAAIENFGSMDILCSDKTGTITTGEMVLDQVLTPAGEHSERTLQLAALNSKYQTGIRSPLDVAILAHPTTTAVPFGDFVKLDEIPFDFERRRLSIVIAHDGEQQLITKGAPDGILPLCTSYDTPSGPIPLNGTRVAQCEETYRHLEEQGYRVLAVAYRAMPKQEAYAVADEQELTLAGYLAFFDPPLEDAAEVLAALRRDGIQVKILTGDGDLVARHICERVGLDGAHVVLGDEIDRMSDPALAQVAEVAHVFARVSPAQKNRILIALKSRSHVVGFLGDGINDAPSLHAADVGISVASAVDVAKDAAEIILMQRSLTVLDEGVLEGRKAFGNVMKYLLMGTSSNFGNMFSMAGAALFLPFLPMLPTQILLNNFLYDLSQVTIPTDNVDATFIQKPHRWDIRLIRDFMIFIGPISSIYDFLTFFLMLQVFHAGEALFHTGWFVESLATQTLVLFVIRTAGNPFKSRPSRPLTITTLAIVAVGIVLPFSPFAQGLGFTPLPALYFLFLAAMTLTYLLLVEIGKRILMSRHPM